MFLELEAIDQKFNTIESRLGYPPKRRFRCYIGRHTNNTLIIEREWESLAAMETAYMKVFMDPEWQALNGPFEAIAESNQVEVYLVMS
ncbi:MAG: hypothetical protein NTV38_08925 [Chloroflexi bacterium]|nr:hypothetical protein [Chloroflexota bacterium]